MLVLFVVEGIRLHLRKYWFPVPFINSQWTITYVLTYFTYRDCSNGCCHLSSLLFVSILNFGSLIALISLPIISHSQPASMFFSFLIGLAFRKKVIISYIYKCIYIYKSYIYIYHHHLSSQHCGVLVPVQHLLTSNVQKKKFWASKTSDPFPSLGSPWCHVYLVLSHPFPYENHGYYRSNTLC